MDIGLEILTHFLNFQATADKPAFWLTGRTAKLPDPDQDLHFACLFFDRVIGPVHCKFPAVTSLVLHKKNLKKQTKMGNFSIFLKSSGGEILFVIGLEVVFRHTHTKK